MHLPLLYMDIYLSERNQWIPKPCWKSYIYALAEASLKPTTIIFINKGVFFTCQGSEVEDILTSTVAEGIEIISCGACLT